jgi:vacuolar iron transporter family protein
MPYLSNKIKSFYFNSAKYSFGATSAIITSLALITSLDIDSSSQLAVIGSLLVVALADNISDTLGIHIYQEGESFKKREVWISTATNFLTRLFVAIIFILIVVIFPPPIATYISIIYGFLILTFISFIIAKKRQTSVIRSVLEHIIIASLVIIASKLAGGLIRGLF